MPDPLSVLIDLAATFRLVRLVTKDGFPPIKRGREWLLRRWPSEDTVFYESEVEGSHLDLVEVERPANVSARDWDRRWISASPHWLGELVTCVWCSSTWLAFLVVILRLTWGWWPWVALGLALSAGVGLLATRLDAE